MLNIYIYIYICYIIPKVHVPIYSENVVGEYGNLTKLGRKTQ